MANINNAVVSERSRSVLASVARESGTPIYVEIYRKMLQLIKEGEFGYGDMLPGEEELTSLTGTGRSSVRSALMLLCEDGYTETRRGRGTFVIYRGDSKEKSAAFPTEYILPRRRLEAEQDDVKVWYSLFKKNTYDQFLDEELSADGKEVNIFIRAYGGESGPAVVSSVYFTDDLIDTEGMTEDRIEEKLEKVFRKKVKTVDTALSISYSTEMQMAGFGKDLPNKKYLLCVTTWKDKKDRPLAYCKDYYNSDILRFRQTFSK
ncbi:MAG: GntR family transcriptional regulator [Oscillospiraceae bacterium]|nr:GntR family transcriptional regulator [Oscillospiraceae bacterium]